MTHDDTDRSIAYRAYVAPLNYIESSPRPIGFWIAFAIACLGYAILIAGTLVPDIPIGIAMQFAGITIAFGVSKLARLPTVPMNSDRYRVAILVGVLSNTALFFLVGSDNLRFRYVTFERIAFIFWFSLVAYSQIAGALRTDHQTINTDLEPTP